MIQRIQTVYLALVVIFCLLGLCLPIGQYFDGTTMVGSFNNFVYSSTEKDAVWDWGPCALGIVQILVVLLTLVSIMLFRFRMRQLRLVIFSNILLVGYLIYYAVLAWKYQLMTEASYHLPFVAVLPVLSIILNCLAIHGIRKDEALVRSLDRLR